MYDHPTLRTSTHDQLTERLQQIRDRRLVMAIQYEAVRKTKLEKLSFSLKEKWEKQNDRNAVALAKIDDALDKLEAGIAKQVQIAHDLTLTENEFKL